MYKQIKVLIDNYAKDDMPDQRAVETFKELEANESISGLRSELIGIKNGSIKLDALKGLLGPKRLARHKSYQEWAKKMILWLAQAKTS